MRAVDASKFKIILHRIISVVCLTNFLSEIWSLFTHDDEVSTSSWAWRGTLSQPSWISVHWWSLATCSTGSGWWSCSLSGYLIKGSSSFTVMSWCLIYVIHNWVGWQNRSDCPTIFTLKYCKCIKLAVLKAHFKWSWSSVVYF